MTSIHFTRNLNTATVGQSLNRPLASAQPSEFLRSMLGSYVYDISETLLKLASGTAFAVLLLTLAHQFTPLLSAAAAAGAMLYLANLSGVRTARDALATILPALAIPIILFWEINHPVALGFGLLIHAGTSFYGTLGQPTGALTEMKFWPVLLGFNATALGWWIVSVV